MPNIKGLKKTNIKKKVSTFAVVSLLLFSVTFGTIVVPKPAQAQWLTTTLGDIPATIMRALDKVKILVTGQITLMAKIALIKAIDTYVSNFAYEAAIRSTSGAPGQKSLIQGKPANIIAEEFAGAAAGDFLEQLSTEVFGHSLCEPLDPNLKIEIGIKLAQSTKPKQPSCTIQKMFSEGVFSQNSVDNISNSFNNLTLEDTVKFAGYFNARQNPIGSLKQAEQELAYKQYEAREKSKTENKDGFKDRLNQTETGVLLPASQVQAGLNLAYNTVADKSTTDKPNTDDPKNPYAAIAIQILSKGLSVFANTALGRIMNQQYTTGITPPPTKPSDFQGSTKTGLSAAKEYFSVLENFTPLYIESDIDITAHLAACPQNTNIKAWNNCRISRGTKDAIDKQLTLREAIEVSKDINAGAIFGYDATSGEYPRFDRGFPYASLVILRKYRVIPVGWELVSQYLENVMELGDHGDHRTWTIQQVMDCFEDPNHPNNNRYPLATSDGVSCIIDSTIDCYGTDPDDESDDPVYDPNDSNTYYLTGCVNPFYHLVNPDWVLKAPETKCYQEGPGPQIVYEQNIELPVDNLDVGISGNTEIQFENQRIIARVDYCADERGCIQEDKDGKCQWWGNCVEEKPIWRFTAESCPAEFNTCQALTKTQNSPGAAKEEEVGYITKTLETCELSAVGCAWYSTYKDPNTGEWEGNTDINVDIDGDGTPDGNGIADRIYLNDDISTCSPSDDGCSLFYKAIDNSDYTNAFNLLSTAIGSGSGYDTSAITSVHLKQAPDYLDCSGTNPPSECDSYVVQCSATEAGCMYYSPLNGDPRIPAKIVSTDQCSEQCIGFSNFTYVPSWFEVDENDSYNLVADIVPDTAEQCTQVGCEVFTNLDEVAQGGEGIEYYTKIRQCITPGAEGTKTYFTWEGSDTSGYQLKRWLMLEGLNGAPCTSVVAGDPGVCDFAATVSCNDLTDPVCRSFFDEAGNTYNASIDAVIYSSEDCHPLRREITGTVYYGITTLSQQCGIENVDCREYKGASANNVQVLYTATFESEDASGTTAAELLFGWEGGTFSSESLEVNGHSLQTNGLVSVGMGNEFSNDKFYTISFTAKGSGNMSVSLESLALTAPVSMGSVTLSNEWGVYTLGPIHLTASSTISDGVDENGKIVMNGTGYVDNIVVKVNRDNYLFIKNSWDIGLAQSCAVEGAFNCELYTPNEGDNIALKSFNQLCEDRFVGCIPMVNSFNTTRTSNTADSGPEPITATTWNISNNNLNNLTSYLDDITTNHDDIDYYVDDEDKYCVASARGCQIVGVPELDRQDMEPANFPTSHPACNGTGTGCLVPSITNFGQVAIINNPDFYSRVLCSSGELFCSLYTSSNGVAQSYIDPGSRSCEYLEIGSDGPGWYRLGIDVLCDTVGATEINPNQPFSNNHSDYDGWVGLCEPQYSSCSQLLDPEPTGLEYVYYVLHDQLNDNDTVPCSQEGIVDRDAGCRLFADTENYSTNIPLYSDLAYDPEISVDGSAPVSSSSIAVNTANILVKVQPDRVCSKFLHCASSLTLQSGGGQTAACLGIGLCSQLDSSSRCASGAADILMQGDVPLQQSISNNQPGTPNTEAAQWSTGMSKLGASWVQGSVSGLYPYHKMVEIGVPLTLPNSDFEDYKNFNAPYSSWPDIDIDENTMQQNVSITGGSAGIFPYEGNYMLEMEMETNNITYIKSALLPSSPGMRLALSFYVNFDILRQNRDSICVAGHRDEIGEACEYDTDCVAGDNTCTPPEFDEVDHFCKLPIGNEGYRGCYDDFNCGSGRSCGTFTCTENHHIICNPNQGVGQNTRLTDDCDGSSYCTYSGSVGISSQSHCTNGDISKIGDVCTVPGQCAAVANAGETGTLCQAVGSILKVDILEGNVVGDSLLAREIDVIVSSRSGWQQVTIPFTITSTSINDDTFRIELKADNTGLGTSEAVGSIMVDNLEIRSGLETGYTTVVAPSCRMYPRTEGLDTDALACDFVDRGTFTGNEIKTYKGWRGYCVEEVPDQSGICMNWWPVDVVQGDVNLFGSGQPIDINYANNLYYCLHSTGDRGNPGNPATECVGTAQDHLCSQITSNYFGLCDRYPGCYWDQDTCMGDLSCLAYDNFPAITGNCGTDPGCTTQTSIQPSTSYTFKTAILNKCINHNYTSAISTLANNIYKSQVSQIIMVWDQARGCDCGCNWPQGGKRYLLVPDRDDPSIWRASDSFDGGQDSFHTEALFNDQNKLHSISYTLQDHSPASGGGKFHYEVFLFDICQTIVRVNTDYGARTPWVSRFNQTEEDPNTFYSSRDQDSSPFGAIVPPSNDFEPFDNGDLSNPWLNTPIYGVAPGNTFYCSDNLEATECARAGSAYSCQGSCGFGRVCIAGDIHRLGVACTVHDDCISANEFSSGVDNRGLCSGYVGNYDQLRAGTPYAFNWGVRNIRSLFAKSYGIYGWDFQKEEYIKCSTLQLHLADQPVSCYWPITTINIQPFTSNTIAKLWPFSSSSVSAAIVDEFDITGCGWTYPSGEPFKYNGTSICSGFAARGKAPEVNNLVIKAPEVNNSELVINEEDININSGQFVTMQFYPSINKDRQPLKGMKVDWGDGTYLKPNQDFSNLAGQGLPIQTYFFVHQFVCGSRSADSYISGDPVNSGLKICGIDYDGVTARTNCWDDTINRCIFIPKIQLKDNWGWCTGDIYKCNINNTDAWHEYTGEIISTRSF